MTRGRTIRRRATMSIVIIILAISATAMITGTLAMTTGATTVQRRALMREQATFLADAGLARAIIMLKNNTSWRVGYSSVSLGSGTYTVTLTDVGVFVDVVSTGAVGVISVETSARLAWE